MRSTSELHPQHDFGSEVPYLLDKSVYSLIVVRNKVISYTKVVERARLNQLSLNFTYLIFCSLYFYRDGKCICVKMGVRRRFCGVLFFLLLHLHGLWGSNSGPKVCTANVLFTGLSRWSKYCPCSGTGNENTSIIIDLCLHSASRLLGKACLLFKALLLWGEINRHPFRLQTENDARRLGNYTPVLSLSRVRFTVALESTASVQPSP